MEKGVILGDIATAPKAQKFFEEAEWLELWSRYFGSVEAGLSDGMVTVRCRKPLAWHPRDLAESLRFEVDLPYPAGRQMGPVPYTTLTLPTKREGWSSGGGGT